MSEQTVEMVASRRGGTHILNEAFFLKHHQEAARIFESYPAADILRVLQGTSTQKCGESTFEHYSARSSGNSHAHAN